MSKVSVIIPVYGVEKYIERCAKSLFEQTLDDMEFIFIDDCTPDGSIEVLEHVIENYPIRKDQIHIVHHEKNGGLPAARQTGIKFATGEYIAHCDSDDWVDINTYQLLYNEATTKKADIVVCDINVTDGKGYNKQIPSCHSTNLCDFIKDCMFNVVSWSLCNKLVHRDLYRNVVFPTGAMGEDLATTTQLLSKAQKIVYLQKGLYNYYQNTTSIIHIPSTEARFKRFCDLQLNTEIAITSLKSVDTLNSIVKKVEPYLRMNSAVPLYSLFNEKLYREIWRKNCPHLSFWYLFTMPMPLYAKYSYVKYSLIYFYKKLL